LKNLSLVFEAII